MDEHSLHSPFIYGLYKDIISKENTNPIFEGIEKVRGSLRANHKEIKIHDLGAGSSVSRKERRKISAIARYGLTTPRNSRLYSRLIEYLGAATVLELGTSLGVNTMYMASPLCVKKVITVEGCPEIASVAAHNFSGFSSSKIVLLNHPIDQALDHIFNRVNRLDLILFDAHHTYDATMDYYHRCKSHIHEHSVLIFDDIHWSKEMTQAWDQIRQEVEVTLTIDLFDIGIVFFRKELEKEDYVLRR